MALRTLAVLSEIERVFLCAYILTGGISLWHIFTVLGVSALLNKCWAAAKNIIDLKDPKEVDELRISRPGDACDARKISCRYDHAAQHT